MTRNVHGEPERPVAWEKKNEVRETRPVRRTKKVMETKEVNIKMTPPRLIYCRSHHNYVHYNNHCHILDIHTYKSYEYTHAHLNYD